MIRQEEGRAVRRDPFDRRPPVAPHPESVVFRDAGFRASWHVNEVRATE